ncbi:M56 family metallopeptidase [Phototrophicus methaneseepsis]|uniref:M56 family metallopeptidase n=1 Tax=Phototrophicus methaneseepsis TaxID=2710758 RepID=A0A7S8EA75_9CHLR|nr:M56 family metallopeptidase [Phototrophicus methaneseepsis]QPC83119.1 M56 family metallopeptidase [Phototrophicus methaneseepsis]
MMKASKSTHNLFTGILIIATICISTLSLCGWLIAWCLDGANVKRPLFLGILLIVGIVILLWQIWRTQSCTKELLNLVKVDMPADVRTLISGRNIDPEKVVLVQSSEPTAFCFGFLNPQVCLSTGLVNLLSKKQLQAVLLHEDYHRQRCDPLRILLLNTLCSTLFFLPFVQEWRRLFEIQLELNADQYAVELTGKGALAGALYQLLSHASHPTLINNKGVVAAGLSANNLRVAALLGNRSTPERISLRSIISTTFILWVLCFILMT